MTVEPHHKKSRMLPYRSGLQSFDDSGHKTGMDFWTRFYVGAMGGLVACVLGAVVCMGIPWVAGVIVAVLSLPAIYMSRRARSSGYVAGFWTIALCMTAVFLLVSPHLHVMFN